MKKTIMTILFACVFAAVVPAQDSSRQPFFTFQVAPQASLPLLDSGNYFGLGFGGRLTGSFALPFLTGSQARVSLDYEYGTLKRDKSVSFMSALAGFGYGIGIIPILGVMPFIDAGAGYGFFNHLGMSESYINPYLRPGIELLYAPIAGFKAAAGASFQYRLGVYTGVGFHLAATIDPDRLFGGDKYGPGGRLRLLRSDDLRIEELVFADVFPIFFTYYDDHALGRLNIANVSQQSVSDIKVSLFIRDFMGAPQEMKDSFALKPGESKSVDLFALLSDRILTLTEKTKVQAELSLAWQVEGEKGELKKVESLPVLDRNAMTWDDDRKAAAFVTPKDTVVMTFAKNVAGYVKNRGNPAINPNLSLAIALHEALNVYGLAYNVDPKSSYSDNSKNKQVIDYLQFPRQSLSFKAGDCDDLSILNCALLESLGVETAFITVPGHIFIAFSTGLKPDEARSQFVRADELIFQADQAWIPVEITQIDGGFLKAWELAARQWRENQARGQAGFFPIHEAWRLYDPVFFKGEEMQVAMPAADRVARDFEREQQRFVDREVGPAVARLQAEIQRSRESPQSVNKLGVLYAKYGLYDKAEREFKRITDKTEFVPGLLNLGSIGLMQKDLKKALDYFNRATAKEPDNAKALLGIARINHEQENYGAAKAAYERLKAVDPPLAGRFAYIEYRGEEASRAAAAGNQKETAVWDE